MDTARHILNVGLSWAAAMWEDALAMLGMGSQPSPHQSPSHEGEQELCRELGC